MGYVVLNKTTEKNTCNKKNALRSNNIKHHDTKKTAKKSFSSPALLNRTNSKKVAKLTRANAKENSRPSSSSTWVFRPTQLARTRRKSAAAEAAKNGVTVIKNPMMNDDINDNKAKSRAGRNKKKITVCKPFSFATASRFGTPKHKKDRQEALKRKDRIAREERRRRTHRF